MSLIHHSFAPLADSQQRSLALRLLFTPSKQLRGPETDLLRQEIEKKFTGHACLFGSGREALLALLQSLKLTPGEEVIIQGYTCVVLPNAIRAAGMVPVYADIQEATLNLDAETVKDKITPRTRVVICQHTFGIPAPVEDLKELCTQHSLILIEDCAHVLPDEHGPEEIGKHGDFLLLSFGRDKSISGVSGGAVICRNPEAAPGLKNIEQQASDLPRSRVRRLLLYPLLYSIAKPFYGIGIGKAFLTLCAKLGLLLPIVTIEEKREGDMQKTLHRLPNACATLVIAQWKRLPEFNAHRRQLSQFWQETSAKHGWPMLHGIRSDLPLQKFPMLVSNASGIRKILKTSNVYLDDGWTNCVVCPVGSNLEKAHYEAGSTTHAETASREILSLPTHPTMTLQHAVRLASILRSVLSHS